MQVILSHFSPYCYHLRHHFASNVTMRCFVAIELASEIKERLCELQTRLGELDRLVRWTRPEQIHLTLNFLGNVPDADTAQLCAATRSTASTLAAFEIEVAGVGCFPAHGPPRVIWAGISGPPLELLRCQHRCEEAFADLG